jgi:hypothetical protein
MAWIDRNGRLFGRVNLIDAVLLTFALMLIPIGVVTSRVFRERQPRIAAVVPASLPTGSGRRIRLQGADFRPYLHIYFNPAGQAFALHGPYAEQSEGRFLLESPSEADVQVPVLPPGNYDIHLLDETREVLLQAGALTIEPLPQITLRAIVRFIAIADVAGLMKAGDTDLPDPSAAGSAAAPAVIESVVLSAGTIPAIDTLPQRAGRSIAVTLPARTVEARLAIPAARSDFGVWTYRNSPVRPGDAFSFETSAYSVRGIVTVVSAAVPSDSQGATP